MKEQTGFIGLRIAPTLESEVKKYAEQNDLSESAAVRRLLKIGLRTEKQQVRVERSAATA